MSKQSRIEPDVIASQKTRRKELADAPSQAGGLPEVNQRIQIIEEILALHSYAISA